MLPSLIQTIKKPITSGAKTKTCYLPGYGSLNQVGKITLLDIFAIIFLMGIYILDLDMLYCRPISMQ